MSLPTILFFSKPQGLWLTRTDYFQELFEILKSRKIIKDYRIAFVEEGYKQKTLIEEHYTIYPSIDSVEVFDEDILWLRGHQCILHPLIKKSQDHWRIAYRAGSGSILAGAVQIEFNDFIDEPNIKKDVLYLPFRKPVSSIFQYKKRPLKYDFCLGANRVYDLKGQYKSYLAILAYDRLIHQQSHCICCGELSKKESGTQLLVKAKGEYLELPGCVERIQLAEIFQQSNVLISATQGQNDRCITEALMCGCPVLLHEYSYQFFPTYITNNPYVISFSDNETTLVDAMKKTSIFDRAKTGAYAGEVSSIEHLVCQWKIISEFSRDHKPSVYNLEILKGIMKVSS
jgi:hypothetical protein